MKFSSMAVTMIAVIGLLAFSLGTASANFVAYNDCVKPQGQTSTATYYPDGRWYPQLPNVSYLGIGVVNGAWDPCPLPASGNLLDWNTGADTGITATFFNYNSVVYMTNPSYPAFWEHPPIPYSGYDNPPATDAGSIFSPYTASIRGVQQYGAAGWYVTLTLENLDPAKTYEFVTSSNRCEYNDRLCKFSISGAEDVTNTSSSGATIGDGGLSTTIVTGNNFVNGHVARWTFKSGSDSNVVLKAENGGAANTKGYAFAAFRLRDITASKISGYVKDAAGNPIVGALVAASKHTNALAASGYAQAQTNTSGYYEMTCLDATTYHVAAWAEGWRASEEVTTTILSNTDTKMVNLTLTPETFNKAIGAAMSSNNASTTNGPEKAIDGSHGVSPLAMYGTTLGTAFTSSADVANKVNSVPTQLLLDRGANVKASEMVIYWDYAWARGYKIQCLPDGYDKSVASTDWDTHGTTLFSTTTGRPGLVNKIPGNIPPVLRDAVPAYDPINYVDVYKFAEQNARYWRIYVDNTINMYYVGVQEIELHDTSTMVAANIGAAKALPNDSSVALIGQRVSAGPGGGVPANVMYIGSADRSAGIRLDTSTVGKNYTFGEVVDVSGVIKTTAAGEKYIAVEAMRKASDLGPLEALGMNNRDAASDTASGMFVKLWGKVLSVDTDYFIISDGSEKSIKVMCGALNKPAVDDKVRVRGVMSKDASDPLLLMRNEQVDWAAIAAPLPLPFPGTYKYVQDWLVLGPFTDGSSGGQTYRLDHDFIIDATAGAVNELTLATVAPPYPGRTVGDKIWTRSDGNGAHVAFAADGTANNSTFYAHVWVYSPIGQNACVRIGSDDSSKVLMYNNAISALTGGTALQAYVTDPVAGRGETWGQDVFTVYLDQGWNSMLLKCENATVTCGADMQFVPYDTPGISGWGGATPIEGLGYLLSNPTL